jgi:hypothetical protein
MTVNGLLVSTILIYQFNHLHQLIYYYYYYNLHHTSDITINYYFLHYQSPICPVAKYQRKNKNTLDSRVNFSLTLTNKYLQVSILSITISIPLRPPLRSSNANTV